MQESHTEINVAMRNPDYSNSRYVHAFRVLLAGAPSVVHNRLVYEALSAKFPEPDYRVTRTYWEVVGRAVG